MSVMKTVFVACVATLTLVSAACAGPSDTTSGAASSAGAVTLTSCGQEMSFDQPPERAVTLDQASTETMLALGLQDRMAGTSRLNTKIAKEYQAAYETVPVLSPEVLTAEQLRAATPDLVVAAFTTNYTKDRVGTREELRELGLPSFVSATACPEDNKPGTRPFDLLFADYENLGRIFGVEDRAAKLVADQRAVVRQAAELSTKVSGEPTVVWVYSTFKGLPYVAGNGSMPSEMSRLVGGKNAFDDIEEDWPEVSWEQVADRDPDIIVVGDLSERGAPGDSAREKLEMMRKHPTVSQLSAVRENRIIQVPGIEMDPSVRTVHTLELLVAGLKDLGYAG
jgi:iron complex transport system substrate-binding protein